MHLGLLPDSSAVANTIDIASFDLPGVSVAIPEEEACCCCKLVLSTITVAGKVRNNSNVIRGGSAVPVVPASSSEALAI